MRPSRASLLLTVGPLALGCGRASECVAGRTCGDARWLDDLVVIDGRQVIAQGLVAAAHGRPAEAARGDDIPVSSRRAYVRFDLSELSSAAGVERAVLSLTPHPSWRTSATSSRLVVRAVGSAWTPERVAAGDGPAMGDDVASVTLPSGVRAPLRVDVTSIVRSWVARTSAPDGLSLEVDGSEAVFVGVGSAQLASRPRLEVVVR